MAITISGGSGTNTISGQASGVSVDSTGALTLPVGTTAQRPTPVAGMIRWNTSNTNLEVYDGTIWEAVTVSPADAYSVYLNGWGGGGGGYVSNGGGGGGAA